MMNKKGCSGYIERTEERINKKNKRIIYLNSFYLNSIYALNKSPLPVVWELKND